MPNNQTEAPTDTIFDAWFTELESEQVDKPKDSDSLYKGWLTPVPDEWIPDWIKSGYNNSIDGLTQQILKGQPVYQINEDYSPGMLADIGSTLISFVQPLDILSIAAGGGIGGLALKSSTKEAAKLMLKSGVKRNIAETAAAKGAQQLAKKIALDKNAVLKYQTTKQAGALGFYSGLQHAEAQKITEGDVGFMDTLEATAKGAILGGVTGAIGGGIATTQLSRFGKTALRLPTETAAFGTIGPALEGQLPSPNDYIHAAGVIGGLGASGFVGRKAIVEPWGKMKKYVYGDIKKREMDIAELEGAAEAKVKEQIGKDLWTDGKRDVVIKKESEHVLELMDTESGEVFQVGKGDFFNGARNEAGDKISKSFKRRSIAGEQLMYEKDIGKPKEVKKEPVKYIEPEVKSSSDFTAEAINQIAESAAIERISKRTGRTKDSIIKDMVEPDIWKGLESGKPTSIDAYHGQGTERVKYAEGMEGPVLGKGRYSALSESGAKEYGDVSPVKVKLKKPVVIKADADLADWMGVKEVPFEWTDRNPLLKRARAQMEKEGYDGVIVNIPKGKDVDAAGRSVKRIREIFDISQTLEFPAKPAKPAPVAKPKAKILSPDQIVNNKTQGLRKKLKLSPEEFKNMVDDVIGKVQEPKFENGKLKSGLSGLDKQGKHKVLENLIIKDKMKEVRKQMVKLGENETYYLDSALKNNHPKVYKGLQRIAAMGRTVSGQLGRHPVGQKSAKMMINSDARSGALTGEYFTLLESIEIGRTKLGRKRKFFDMTREEANALARDLEKKPEDWQLPHTKKVRKLFDLMYAEAEKTGMPIREKLENYFPHVIKEEVMNILQKDMDRMINRHEVLAKDNLAGDRIIEEQLKAIVKEPNALKPETIKALEHLREVTGSYSNAFENLRTGINSERYTLNKHLEKGRKLELPDELLEKDARIVLPEYIQRLSKRVGYVEHFGVEGEKMFGNINALQNSGFHNEARVLRDTFDSFTNLSETNPARNYRRSTKNFWNSMVNFGIGTKIGMGFATLPNLGQPMISSALLAGIPRTAWGLFRYHTDPTYKKFIRESGAMTTSQSVSQLVAGYNPTKGTKMGAIANWMTKYVGLTIPYFSFKGPKLSEVGTKPWQYLTKRVRGLPIITFQSINRNNQIISAVAGFEGMKKWQRWANGKGVGGKNPFNRLRSIEHLNEMGYIENYDKYSADLKSGKINRNEFFNKVNKELNSTLKSETKQREGIYRFAIDSQLQRNILREPVYFNDPRFRPFILFKRFGYRQFEYIFKNSWREFKYGNAPYFLRLMAGGMIYGPLLNSAKRVYRDWLAGEDVYDENYSVTEVVEDYDNIRAEMEKNGYSIDNFFDAAEKNISVGDLFESFAAIGAYGFVGDVAQAMYEGEQELFRAGEFLLKPAVAQDMLVGIDAATRFLVDKHEFGWGNAFRRLPKRIAPAFGTIPREVTKRLWTEGQRESYQKYRKGGIRARVLDAFLDNDDKLANELVKAWNRANPENQFDYNDISWSEMYKRAARKAKKRMNP